MKEKPQLSRKNKYFVEKHRYYELKHFCLQYPLWKKTYLELTPIVGNTSKEVYVRSSDISNPTAKIAEQRMLYLEKMQMIEQTALKTDGDLYSYILKGVTTGMSFDQMDARDYIPCGRDTYYDRYRKFFWLLDKVRD